MSRDSFKLIKAPKRTPKPAPPVLTDHFARDQAALRVLRIVRRLLREMRWDNQGGYSSRRNGRWSFVSTGLGQVTPPELDALFEFAGMTPDEIEVVGHCEDCANSNDGHERGYVAPCVSCLRPSHINGFVPIADVTKKKRSKNR